MKRLVEVENDNVLEEQVKEIGNLTYILKRYEKNCYELEIHEHCKRFNCRTGNDDSYQRRYNGKASDIENIFGIKVEEVEFKPKKWLFGSTAYQAI